MSLIKSTSSQVIPYHLRHGGGCSAVRMHVPIPRMNHQMEIAQEVAVVTIIQINTADGHNVQEEGIHLPTEKADKIRNN